MSNMSPFEIRLELLKMSMSLLESNYHIKAGFANDQWQRKYDYAVANGLPLPYELEATPYPSEKEIIAKATELNKFVSNT